MVKGEPSAKRTQEGDDAMPMMKEDDTMPMVKEDDAMPVVNQDETLVNPFGDRDDWTICIMSRAFWKIKRMVENTDLGTLTPPQVEKVSSYIFIFHQLTDVLEELPAYLNRNRANNAEYILACY
jgi:hypothetical protein